MKAPCLNWSGPTLFSCIVAQSKGPKPSRSGCSEPEKDTEPARPLKRRRASRSNTCCEFLGKLVCKHALRCLYGIGSGTVNKIYKGEKALHYGQGRKHPKHPQLGYALRDSTRTKWPSVVMYFWLLYHNVAEVLNGLRCPSLQLVKTLRMIWPTKTRMELSDTCNPSSLVLTGRCTIPTLPTWGREPSKAQGASCKFLQRVNYIGIIVALKWLQGGHQLA